MYREYASTRDAFKYKNSVFHRSVRQQLLQKNQRVKPLTRTIQFGRYSPRNERERGKISEYTVQLFEYDPQWESVEYDFVVKNERTCQVLQIRERLGIQNTLNFSSSQPEDEGSIKVNLLRSDVLGSIVKEALFNPKKKKEENPLVSCSFKWVNEDLDTEGHGHRGFVSSMHYYQNLRKIYDILVMCVHIQPKPRGLLPPFTIVCQFESVPEIPINSLPDEVVVSILEFVEYKTAFEVISLVCKRLHSLVHSDYMMKCRFLEIFGDSRKINEDMDWKDNISLRMKTVLFWITGKNELFVRHNERASSPSSIHQSSSSSSSSSNKSSASPKPTTSPVTLWDPHSAGGMNNGLRRLSLSKLTQLRKVRMEPIVPNGVFYHMRVYASQFARVDAKSMWKFRFTHVPWQQQQQSKPPKKPINSSSSTTSNKRVESASIMICRVREDGELCARTVVDFISHIFIAIDGHGEGRVPSFNPASWIAHAYKFISDAVYTISIDESVLRIECDKWGEELKPITTDLDHIGQTEFCALGFSFKGVAERCELELLDFTTTCQERLEYNQLKYVPLQNTKREDDVDQSNKEKKKRKKRKKKKKWTNNTADGSFSFVDEESAVSPVEMGDSFNFDFGNGKDGGDSTKSRKVNNNNNSSGFNWSGSDRDEF